MIINIRIADPDNKRAHNSLHNWLNNNQYIKENAQLKLLDSAPDGRGPEFDTIQRVRPREPCPGIRRVARQVAGDGRPDRRPGERADDRALPR